MAPKTATKAAAAAPKKAKTEAAHPTYQEMIKDALIQLKDRSGSSRQALKKYVLANFKLGNMTDAAFNQRFNHALSKGSETGAFERPKGPSGPVKLGKGTKTAPAEKKEKAAAPKAAAKPKAASTKKTATKAAAPKKAAATTKKAAAPKAAAKKTATKPKANTSKPRKTAPAPAVEDKPTVLGKTKSGRVTKTKAAPAAAKKASTKKAPAKKAAAAKK